ncbi:hypothetical protein GCM10010353_34570 [Streptomyces chryseus]|nr:hypothetical protein GCM10010353_34570 [Streptomyces chryseus]
MRVAARAAADAVSAETAGGTAVTSPATVAPTANSTPARFFTEPPVLGERGCEGHSPRRIVPESHVKYGLITTFVCRGVRAE